MAKKTRMTSEEFRELDKRLCELANANVTKEEGNKIIDKFNKNLHDYFFWDRVWSILLTAGFIFVAVSLGYCINEINLLKA